jgi:lipoprotein NlpD
MNLNIPASRRFVRLGLAALGSMLLVACGARPPAPVVDRSSVSSRAAEAARAPVARPAPVRPAQAVPAAPPVAVAQSFPARPAAAAGSRPSPAESAANDAPLIQVETIRSESAPIAPAPVRPASGAGSVTAPPPTQAQQPSIVESPPVQPAAPASSPAAAQSASVPPQSAAVQPGPAQRDPAPPAAAAGAGSARFVWPARGPVLERFSEPQNPAIYLDGRPGDPVLAAAEGRVIFSGPGPKGYGNLIIVRHDEQFLSVYGHNRTLLAKEGEQVKQGQAIAELGSSDSDRPRLRFEIRRDGRPVDPVKLLPPR